ncbi:adenylate cyclase [Rhizobium mongolense USDA 1844]|uniref:Adenylate cyclase n=1 Tax=Rhizobium mongolense USDA 1844 TaxID=1079460 RepID=A0A559TDF7_9HYPH|nr:adenylate cyclase [Rhizobium mongolense USDA 1844]
MSTIESSVSSILLDRVAEWLTNSSLAGDDLENIVRGFCERIAAAGLPIARVHLTFSMLHPLYDALGFTWRRASGVTIEGYRHSVGAKPDRFSKARITIFSTIICSISAAASRLMALRNSRSSRTCAPRRSRLSRLRAALRRRFCPGHGLVVDGQSFWLFRRHDRCAAAHAEPSGRRRQDGVLGKLANNMLTTYLGGDAGKRVLNGQIRRGDGETIRAALVMGDMRQSTMYAEKEGRQAYIDTLNEFFDAIAAPFNRNGGEILSFLGDGFLAVYPCGRHKDPSKIASQAALSAVHQAQARVAELNNERAEKGLGAINYGIGLHIGNVMLGNVGLKDRLTFSAFGSAVNEVQRLQALTKKYNREVVASQAFAGYCGGEWTTLGEEKLRGIRQKVTILQPRAPAPARAIDGDFREVAPNGLSEAEQVILLHRDAKKQAKRATAEGFVQ